MCRYAFKEYKERYACFGCRKAFKKRRWRDLLCQEGKLHLYDQLVSASASSNYELFVVKHFGISLEKLESKLNKRAYHCPGCKKEMVSVGKDFKCPTKTDLQAWRRLEGMYKVGHAFQTCGCMGLRYVPSNHSEYVSYLRQVLQEYEASLLHRQGGNGADVAGDGAVISYWDSRISAVKAELQGLSV
jgi:hypothetical protein